MPIRKRMWFIPVVIASVVLIGAIAGGMIAAADTGSDSAVAENQTVNQSQALLDKACAIYQEQTCVAIDPQQLKAALQQAQSEARDEALQNRLQNLVSQGKLTQEQADQFLQWWQSRPDIPLPLAAAGPGGRERGMMWRGPVQVWGAPSCTPDDSGGTSN